MDRAKTTAVITVRCTEEEKKVIADMAWKGRTHVSAYFQPLVKKLAKRARLLKIETP